MKLMTISTRFLMYCFCSSMIPSLSACLNGQYRALSDTLTSSVNRRSISSVAQEADAAVMFDL